MSGGYRFVVLFVVTASILMVVASVGVALVDDGDRPTAERVFTGGTGTNGGGTSTGTGTSEHDRCAGGDMDACDSLYSNSESGSADETFGSTCGNTRSETQGGCSSAASDSSSSDFGSDPQLASLHSGCADGDMAACDQLYYEADADSADEYFGSTCGGQTEQTFGGCSGD